jgi:tRNA-2-methylthio-N6-dimethylallyladenosine synthase
MEKDYSKYFIPSITRSRKRTKNSATRHDFFSIDKSFLSLGKNRSFYIKTYGCQSNLRDSEDIVGILKKLNFKLATSIENADLIILNTCAVRENAEKKVFGKIGQFKMWKKTKPNSIFTVCGCMAQEEEVVNKIAKQLKQVDLVFGTHNIHMLPEMLNEVINQKQRVIYVQSKEGDVIEGLPIDRSSKIKAFVNIMFGCDKFCTYCIVPYTRGQIRSRSKDDVLKEVNQLIKDGYKEVTLLGQNVNSYGIDFDHDYHFYDLLEDVAKTKIPRVRFVTSNP